MSYRNKKSVIKLFIFCLGLIIIESFCFSYYYCNGSSGGYNEETQTIGIQSNISMEIMVTEGAGYFFQVHAMVQTLLNMVELQDIKAIDYIELDQMVKSSLINIINARITFEKLIKVAEATSYNIEVIEQLNRFDYDTFMNEYGLNPFIFAIVRDYLINGDITSTYKHAYGNFRKIEQLLLNIQSATLANKLPESEIFWRLNELCAEETLIGSYIARIFKAIK